jgi:hypothetical protein
VPAQVGTYCAATRTPGLDAKLSFKPSFLKGCAAVLPPPPAAAALGAGPCRWLARPLCLACLRACSHMQWGGGLHGTRPAAGAVSWAPHSSRCHCCSSEVTLDAGFKGSLKPSAKMGVKFNL